MLLDNAVIITVAGSCLTLLVNSFATGVAYGKLSAKIDKNSTDIIDSNDDMTRLEQGLQAQIAGLSSKFVDSNGEPRLLSYPAHDIICDRQAQIILSEFSHITKALDANSQAVKELGVLGATMTVVVAVLQKGVDDKRPGGEQASGGNR
jgi:hypothetical protein